MWYNFFFSLPLEIFRKIGITQEYIVFLDFIWRCGKSWVWLQSRHRLKKKATTTFQVYVGCLNFQVVIQLLIENAVIIIRLSAINTFLPNLDCWIKKMITFSGEKVLSFTYILWLYLYVINKNFNTC